MEAGVEPRGLWPDSGMGRYGRSRQDTRTWGRDSQTHTHGRRVDTGPNQPCTHTGTDEGLETHRDTWTHMWT